MRYRRDFGPFHDLKTGTKRRLGGVGGWAAAQARLMAPVERRPSRGAPTGLLNMKNTALVHVPPRLVHARRWGGEIRFFFASRFYLGLAVAIPDAPGSTLGGYVVGVRI